ncbi:MAG: phosphohistidine phosphatase SixA [Acidobacteria bacterium]|nr:phosphohistidine phosphatase SixA [Acidobacteriota bacterium]
MELYFMRHGIATPKEDGGPDADRPLVPEGIKKSQQAAEALRNLEIEFDRILTSPLVRARQTADIVANVLQMQDRIEELEELADHSVKEVVRALTKFKGDDRLLLVGHQNQMGDTIAYLLGGEDKMQVDLKKSGICLVEVDSLPPKSRATLCWMLSPKHMKLMT